MVNRFCSVGIDEYVLYWPGSWRPDAAKQESVVFEQITADVIPALRAAAV
jgi:hypothetical protein